MDVVLIDPPTSHEQIYGDWDLSKLDTYCPPLGLLYLAGYLRQNGHAPHVVDMTAQKWSLSQTIEFVQRIRPGLVGISAKTINVFNAAELASRIKQAGLDAPIILGGAHMTAVPEETLRRFPAFDLGVIGEGEITLLELVERFAHHAPVSDLKGIVWRNDGQIVVNPPRELIPNLDVLPLPAWDLLESFPSGYTYSALETKRLPAASIMTSRGCPYSCTFCDNAVFGTRVRHHSADYTIGMLHELRTRYGIRDLMILDDNFLLLKDKLFQICDAMCADELRFSWYCMGHAKFMSADRLKRIREAGCWIIELGIESGCDRILKILKKNTTKQEIAEAVARAREAGLRVKGNFIFGCPTETKESLEETIEFATRIPLSLFQQNFMTIWPGCELSERPGEYGQSESDWRQLAHQRITFVPHGLTEADLIRASRKAFRRFYLRPRVILEMLGTLTSLRALSSAFAALAAFLGTILRRAPQKRTIQST